jgi:hypothetical protein
MTEDLLHNLIDGDLPDDEAAELLHRLSVDPERRTLFQQHIRLQHELARNETYGALSAEEESHMLARLTRSIGADVPVTRKWLTGGMIGTLAVGLLIGTGAGVLVDRTVFASSSEPRAERTIQQDSAPSYTADTLLQTIDRDSHVSAILDSLARNSRVSTPTVTRSPVVRATPRKRYSSNSNVSSSGAVTGMPIHKRPRKHR